MNSIPDSICKPLQKLQKQVELLRRQAPDEGNLKFTLDGRLIGDIGENIASEDFNIKLNGSQKAGYDGTDTQGQHVEIKTTQKNSFAFTKVTERVICLKLDIEKGTYEVIFNGKGKRLLGLFSEAAFKDNNRKITRKTPLSLNGQRQIAISKFHNLRQS